MRIKGQRLVPIQKAQAHRMAVEGHDAKSIAAKVECSVGQARRIVEARLMRIKNGVAFPSDFPAT